MESLRVVCGTWNVHYIDPLDKGLDLTGWLCQSEEKPDILAITLQEIVHLNSPTSYMPLPTASPKTKANAKKWSEKILKTVNSEDKLEYFIVGQASLVGLHIVVLGRTAQAHQFESVAVGTTKGETMMGNKGGVCVRFDYVFFDGTRRKQVTKKSFCFVGVHLDAGPNQDRLRNNNLSRIFRSMIWRQPKDLSVRVIKPGGKLKIKNSRPARTGRKTTSTRDRPTKETTTKSKRGTTNSIFGNRHGTVGSAHGNTLSCTDLGDSIGSEDEEVDVALLEHDTVIVFGDLNYRIEGIDAARVVQMIETNNLKDLLINYEHLKKQMKVEVVFDGFQESEITFKPTYKFRGANYKIDKERVPSWTDRVIFRTADGVNVQKVRYESVPEYNNSDHKPLIAEYIFS